MGVTHTYDKKVEVTEAAPGTKVTYQEVVEESQHGLGCPANPAGLRV
ncbi:hypothetical protein ACFV4K_29700 [Nocardia sp. NPDC059764]